MLFLLAWVLAITPFEEALQAHGWGRPKRTAALDAAARALARRVDLQADSQIAAGQLAFVLEEAGINDGQVVPVVTVGALPVPKLLARLDRLTPPTHYGHGVVHRDGQPVHAVVLVHRGFTPEAPLPRAQSEGAFSLRGSLRAGYFKPRLLIAPPRRAVYEVPAAGTGRTVAGIVTLNAGPGVYGVELVAESQYGPVVLLNHRVYVGVPVPQRPTVRLRPSTPTTQPAAVLTAWINDLRRHHGLGRLWVHPTLVQAAQQHAAELARQGRLVHFSPDTGALTTRLKALGMRPLAVAENLAEATDPRAAIAALLDSPGHKRNLLQRGMTHLGVAVVGRMYAVVLARLPQGSAPRP